MPNTTEQLPIAQLESLKYRVTQIMESITALQFLVDANGAPAMPPWPDMLARYNLLLSQTHSLSVSLSFALAHHQSQQQQQLQQQLQPPALQKSPPPPQNPFQNLVLHPSRSIPEQQLDHALAPLLRNQPTLQVLNEEDASVRRIAAVIKSATPEGVPAVPGTEGCELVVNECTEIKRAHDSRVERAVKAVALLRDRYEWRARVEAGEEQEQEQEQEELDLQEQERRSAETDGFVVIGDEDVMMAVATPLPVEAPAVMVLNGRDSEASTPASSRSDEANELRVTEDVLGAMSPTPG